MPYRYSFGFKLSNSGKRRLQTWLANKGYKVVGMGWDSITVETQVSSVDKQALMSNLLQALIKEEEI